MVRPAAATALATLALLGSLHAAAAQNLPLPPLPYEYNALEPVIDEETMRTHHLAHHKGYTDKLNAALGELREDSEHKHLAKLGVDTLLHRLDQVPSRLRGAIRNNGGGYVNHDLFWKSMRPPSEGNAPRPGSRFARAIDRDFGSFEAWKATFTASALSVFGSGWAWVVVNDVGELAVVTTPNQDTPDLSPVLGIDVWEHAYYLKYKNRRAEYIEGFYRLIDWDAAEARLASLTDRTEL